MPDSTGLSATLEANQRQLFHGRSAALELALNRIWCGVIVTSLARRPSFINFQARRLLDRGDVLLLVDGVLHGRTSADTQRLQRALADAHATSGASIAISMRADGIARNLSVLVLRVPDHQGNESVLFVSDASLVPTVSQPILRAVFGFTRSEAVVAELLMQGYCVETAADKLCVSVHTVRTHVKRILLKTDTGRQGELIRVMLLSAGLISIG